jgi:AraC-like DNA-binding protein
LKAKVHPSVWDSGHVISFKSERWVGESRELTSPEMQILLVLYGSGQLRWNSDSVSVGSGDLLVIRPGVIHHFSGCEALQMARCGLLPRGFRKRVGLALDSKAYSVLFDSAPVKKYEIPSDKFRSIASLLTASSIGGDMGNVGRMLLLLETVVEHARPPVASLHQAVFRAVQAFDENIAKEWSLPEIAEVIHLDPSYVARLFTSNLGEPPLSYLALMRAEEAALRLLTGDTPCAAIGESVGWHDANYFSRRIRQHFGQSPTSFRETQRNSQAFI